MPAALKRRQEKLWSIAQVSYLGKLNTYRAKHHQWFKQMSTSLTLSEIFSTDTYKCLSSMGSHHHQVVTLVPDDKLDCFGLLENFFLVKNGLAFHPGPSLPPETDGSSFLKLGTFFAFPANKTQRTPASYSSLLDKLKFRIVQIPQAIRLSRHQTPRPETEKKLTGNDDFSSFEETLINLVAEMGFGRIFYGARNFKI